jgi:hypothetical protein
LTVRIRAAILCAVFAVMTMGALAQSARPRKGRDAFLAIDQIEKPAED